MGRPKKEPVALMTCNVLLYDLLSEFDMLCTDWWASCTHPFPLPYCSSKDLCYLLKGVVSRGSTSHSSLSATRIAPLFILVDPESHLIWSNLMCLASLALPTVRVYSVSVLTTPEPHSLLISEGSHSIRVLFCAAALQRKLASSQLGIAHPSSVFRGMRARG